MNPPTTEDQDSGYAGSEPLDKALADRFGFVVQMPAWSGFSKDQQLAVIRAGDDAVSAEGRKNLADLLGRTQELLSGMSADFEDGIADYVQPRCPCWRRPASH